jgi:hypothetical protein
VPRPILFPAGAKIIGCNLSCSPTVGQGTTNPYILMHLAWATEWPYIKRQIDTIVGNGTGANCLRIFGAGWGILGGLVSQSVVNANLLQVASYCQSLGVYFYFNWATQIDAPSAAYTPQQVANSVASSLLPIQALGNCIGCDVVQECADNIWTPAYLIEVMARVRALVPEMPVTCSQGTLPSWSPTPLWLNAFGDACDFIDVHTYATVDSQYYEPLLARFPNHDLIVGEIGGHAAESSDVVVARLANASREMMRPDPRRRGILYWTVADDWDTPLTSAFGFHTSAFAPRQERLNVIRRTTGGSLARSLSRFR